jgi:DNA-binding NarL/FixJ family response regulator
MPSLELPDGQANCFRCGALFARFGLQRICPACRKLVEPRDPRASLAHKPLSFRERQVVDMVAEGKANKEIAFSLHLTEGTIKEYIFRIFQKTGANNRTELAVMHVKGTA